MSVQRYFVACDPYVAWSLLVQVDPEGMWVKHTDHAAEIARLEARIERAVREAYNEGLNDAKRGTYMDPNGEGR